MGVDSNSHLIGNNDRFFTSYLLMTVKNLKEHIGMSISGYLARQRQIESLENLNNNCDGMHLESSYAHHLVMK